jgi:hypothetical protein
MVFSVLIAIFGFSFLHSYLSNVKGEMMKGVFRSILISMFVTSCLVLVHGNSFAQLLIGQNFAGSNQSQSGFIPPDTDGAIGPNSYAELVNGTFAVFSRTGASLMSESLNQFWINAGVTPSNYAYDPRIIYDKSSGRWFASSLDNPNKSNNFLIAYSKTSDPTAGWVGYSIPSFGSGTTNWADFDTLGVNSNGVYLGANYFPIGTNTNYYTGFVAIPKAQFIAGLNPSYTQFLQVDPNATGYSVQPSLDLNGSFTVENLLSDYNTPAGLLQTSVITLGNPGTLTSSNGVATTSYNLPPNAQQPGGVNPVDTGDNRFSSSVQAFVNPITGKQELWGVQTVMDNGVSALHWVRIDVATNSIVQDGLINDPNSVLNYFYGSIAVSNSGVVIGFNVSSSNQFISSYAVGGLFNALGNVTFGNPILLKAGSGVYSQLVNNVNRWGDYSATTVDPLNPNSFWTIQELPLSNNNWSTQITQLLIPQSSPNVPEPNTLVFLLSGLTGMSGLFLNKLKRA